MWVFFFFQAEDGIRYRTVTGVQTCALPICPGRREGRDVRLVPRRARDPEGERSGLAGPPAQGRRDRSEERRVGKECRSRRRPERWKQKEKASRRTLTTAEQGSVTGTHNRDR